MQQFTTAVEAEVCCR